MKRDVKNLIELLESYTKRKVLLEKTTLYDYMRDDLHSYVKQNQSIAPKIYAMMYDIDTNEIPEGKTNLMLVRRMENEISNCNDYEIVDLYKLFKQHTGGDFGQESFKYKEILGEAGKIRADLRTPEKIAAYVKTRIRNYSETLTGLRFQRHQNLLMVSNLNDDIKPSVFIQIAKDLEKNGFTNIGNKKVNNKTYLGMQDKNKNLVYLPI